MTVTSPPRGDELFARAARDVVSFMRECSELSDWSVSRVTDGVQVHLHVQEETSLRRGEQVPWAGSFCQQMMSGASPIVRDVAADPAYADLAMAQRFRAYAGIPIDDGTGHVFGMLCGVDPWPVEAMRVVDLDLLRFGSRMLTHQLTASRLLDTVRAEVDTAHASALTDELTTLLNRRGWNRAVVEAERALEAYGDPVHVAIVDADGLKTINDSHGHLAGDTVLRSIAECLTRAAGDHGAVARLSGDEFGLLCAGVDADRFASVMTCVADELDAAGLAASTGSSQATHDTGGVSAALGRADDAMYEQKRARASAR